jgi:hypothetical protein
MLASHIPSRALVGPRETYDRTLRMDFITTVTAVTKYQQYPLRLHTIDTHQSERACVPTIGRDPLPKNGDSGDNGNPDASDRKTSLKRWRHSRVYISVSNTSIYD